MASRRPKKRAPRWTAAAKKRVAELEARVVELEGVLAQHGKLGPPPIGNVLESKAWVYGFLLEELDTVRRDPQLDAPRRRNEVLKIVDRINKLDDKAEIHGALEQMHGANKQLEKRRAGPQMTDATDVATATGPVTARRGRPPGRSLR